MVAKVKIFATRNQGGALRNVPCERKKIELRGRVPERASTLCLKGKAGEVEETAKVFSKEKRRKP